MVEADLPNDTLFLILKQTSARTIMRFASTNKASDELVAKSLVEIIARDIPASYRAFFHFPFEGEWGALRRTLTLFYKNCVERVARSMAKAITELTGSLSRTPPVLLTTCSGGSDSYEINIPSLVSLQVLHKPSRSLSFAKKTAVWHRLFHQLLRSTEECYYHFLASLLFGATARASLSFPNFECLNNVVSFDSELGVERRRL